MKMYLSLPLFVIIMTLLLPVQFSNAAEGVYGWDLMSDQEREEHENHISSLETEKEREAFRKEHEKKMQKRVEADDIHLPVPPRP